MKQKLTAFTPSRRTALMGGLALAGFSMAPAAFANIAPLNVVATTGMIADVVRRIGGDLVSVKGLMGTGVDPHGYRQTRSDIVAMTRADLVLWHGLYLEAQMEPFFEDLASKRPVIAVADGLPVDQLLAHEDYEGRYDPHVWMDPLLWVGVVQAVTKALSDVAPQHKAVFEENTISYLAELDALRIYAHETLGKVPADQRVLLTAHDAFGYFGSAFGFEVIGIQGISTASEAGLNRISALVDMLVERQIASVFVETSVSDRNIRALIEGAQAQGHTVQIGGALYSDAMGEAGTYEGTYLGMIDHNVTTIAGALGAPVDQAGRLGKLGMGS